MIFDTDKLAEIKARIVVNDGIAHQPIGGHGFRTGKWTALVDGVPRQFNLSIPHAAELDEQYEIARGKIAQLIYRAEMSA